MKDYTYISILEAATTEMTADFVAAIKTLDSTVAANRIFTLLMSNGHDKNFLNIAGQFNSLVGCKTSGDES